MAYSRNNLWGVIYIPMLALLYFALLQPSHCTSSDYYVDARETPPAISENTMRHIMQLVSLGTGLNVPPPLNLKLREKSLKRARITAPRPRRPDFVIGSEFLGKRSSPPINDDDKRMGSEFLGKRMGSEFLGKRMGSEFLGKRMGSEFLGKRMGSEFLGKRMGSEFLGKRMGSEFLGKRMGSEFLGKRSDADTEDESPYQQLGSENSGKESDAQSEDIGPYKELQFYNKVSVGDIDDGNAYKRMGSEFLGKRMGSEFLGKRDQEDGDVYKRMGSEFLGKRSKEGEQSHGEGFDAQKRMGSEFLGRKRRQTKATERRTSSAKA